MPETVEDAIGAFKNSLKLMIDLRDEYMCAHQALEAHPDKETRERIFGIYVTDAVIAITLILFELGLTEKDDDYDLHDVRSTYDDFCRYENQVLIVDAFNDYFNPNITGVLIDALVDFAHEMEACYNKLKTT
jgi:hypothetical protein